MKREKNQLSSRVLLYKHHNPRVFKMWYLAGCLHCAFWLSFGSLTYWQLPSKLSSETRKKISTLIASSGLLFILGAHVLAKRQVKELHYITNSNIFQIETANLFGSRLINVTRNKVEFRPRIFTGIGKYGTDMKDNGFWESIMRRNQFVKLVVNDRAMKMDRTAIWPNVQYLESLLKK